MIPNITDAGMVEIVVVSFLTCFLGDLATYVFIYDKDMMFDLFVTFSYMMPKQPEVFITRVHLNTVLQLNHSLL